MERYERQEMIRGWNAQIVREANVLVVGAGTTGNEVTKNLTLLGIGRITVVDMDNVEVVNLSRSVLFRDEDIGRPKAEVVARRAMELNPEVQVTGLAANIVFNVGNLEYGKFDCAILTVDNLEARMWVNRYCWINQTALIDTGIEGLLGNIHVIVPQQGPCIECDWNVGHYKRLADRYSCLKIGLVPDEAKIPMVITTASTIGGMAVQECVRVLHDKASGAKTKAGTFYWYNAEDIVFMCYPIPVRENCPGHEKPIINRCLLNEYIEVTDKVATIKAVLRNNLGADAIEIWHDKQIVYTIVCDRCATVYSINPVALGLFRRSLCTQCGTLTTRPYEETAELRNDYSLEALSVPRNHLLRVLFAKDKIVNEIWVRTR